MESANRCNRLIAIMLGRLRMSVADTISEYERLGNQVFGRPRRGLNFKWRTVNKAEINSLALEQAFNRIAVSRITRLPDKSVSFILPSGVTQT